MQWNSLEYKPQILKNQEQMSVCWVLQQLAKQICPKQKAQGQKSGSARFYFLKLIRDRVHTPTTPFSVALMLFLSLPLTGNRFPFNGIKQLVYIPTSCGDKSDKRAAANGEHKLNSSKSWERKVHVWELQRLVNFFFITFTLRRECYEPRVNYSYCVLSWLNVL